ncbi:MAG: ribosome silencing factor [Actinomycetota bacterium]|nr:ribosome silencing factor [Actinomycetota bacterium]MDA3013903.1 ribosome silencing factor [Actinomycetota bacterium]
MTQKLNIDFQKEFLINNILDLMFSQKFSNIKVIELKNNSFHDYVLIATANSIAQINPIIKKIKENLKIENFKYEGFNSSWLLISLNDILIQIFNEESRDYYNIEDIYFDSQTIAKFG